MIAKIADSKSAMNHVQSDESPPVFRTLQIAARNHNSKAGRDGQTAAGAENPDDGTYVVRVRFDYDVLWRGREKEILDAVKNSIDSHVTFLTEDQNLLLQRSPREFLALTTRPESVELLAYRSDFIGGSEQVVELTVAAAPMSPAHIRHIAIIPNLVQIERQLDALEHLEAAADDGPLAPLRALIGLSDASSLLAVESLSSTSHAALLGESLDDFQTECIRKAMSTPHFAVIQGPPGSGKTTVIASVIRRAVARGDRVIVVSPTHAAIDNVVEKLAPPMDHLSEDRLDPHTVPLRYAARKSKLSARATEYWVGSKGQVRAATISQRLRQRLIEKIPNAEGLYAHEDENAVGFAALSSSLAAVDNVICGTPIGILSHLPIKNSAPGTFDLLIVDEVSKMTLPEFLAIAIKAKRWVLVGDPQQLPPFNNCEENATTLDDVMSPLLELVCSVGAVLESAKPQDRRSTRLVVVTDEPHAVADAIRAHIAEVLIESSPRVTRFGEGAIEGVVVCAAQELENACAALSPIRRQDRTCSPEYCGDVRILVQRGLLPSRSHFADGKRLITPRERAQSRIFETAYSVYHVQPWSERSNQKMMVVGFRNGLNKYLPSTAALKTLNIRLGVSCSEQRDQNYRYEIAVRFAINTISVYDWLTGFPAEYFDVSPLRELKDLSPRALADAVRPFVGVLKKQYRMHASISRVPRALFYFGEALHDGKPDDSSDCRVVLVPVKAEGEKVSEINQSECNCICALLTELNSSEVGKAPKPGIMVITPYKDQKVFLTDAIERLRQHGGLDRLDVDVFTLDSCQGREAEYVLISLVKSHSTPFLDMPKRWNVALTRAMQGLFIVGNIDGYRQEASEARSRQRTNFCGESGPARPQMSLLARIIESYGQQIGEHPVKNTSNSTP